MTNELLHIVRRTKHTVMIIVTPDFQTVYRFLPLSSIKPGCIPGKDYALPSSIATDIMSLNVEFRKLIYINMTYFATF